MQISTHDKKYLNNHLQEEKLSYHRLEEGEMKTVLEDGKIPTFELSDYAYLNVYVDVPKYMTKNDYIVIDELNFL